MSAAFILARMDQNLIRNAARRALANPMSLEMLKRIAETGRRLDGAPRPQDVELPLGWRLNITCEEQPDGLCFHLSMSSPTPAKTVPGPEVVRMVLDLLGCGDLAGPPWIEEFKEDGAFAGRAVNVIVAVPRGQTQ
jgi:hypothetical protein